MLGLIIWLEATVYNSNNTPQLFSMGVQSLSEAIGIISYEICYINRITTFIKQGFWYYILLILPLLSIVIAGINFLQWLHYIGDDQPVNILYSLFGVLIAVVNVGMHFGFIIILYRNLSVTNQKKFQYISIVTSLSSVALLLVAGLTYFGLLPFDALYLAATLDLSSFIYSNQLIVASMKRKPDNDISLPSALKSNKKKKLKVRFRKQCLFNRKKKNAMIKPVYVRQVSAPTIRPVIPINNMFE